MNNTPIYKAPVFLALLLSAVLTGSILIKPVHILLIHHGQTEQTDIYSCQKTFSIPHDHDCAICDFEFCSFIPQKQVIVPQVNVFSIHEPASLTIDSFVGRSSHDFQLRAPPAF